MSDIVKRFAPALAWAAAVWFVGGLETTPSVPSGLWLDKVAHFGIYGVLGWLLGRGWLAQERRAWLVLLLPALLLGAADELRQRSIPGRSAELADWVADAAGAATGLYLSLRAARRSRADEGA